MKKPWIWILGFAGILAIIVATICFLKIAPEADTNPTLQIVHGVISLVLLMSLLGLSFFASWLAFKLAEKQTELNRQAERDTHDKEVLDKHYQNAEKPEVKNQKWQMDSLLKLAELLKEKTVEEEDKEGEKKTTTEKIDKPTKNKLNELFEKILKPNQKLS